jgi:Tol biopolymer transport system component
MRPVTLAWCPDSRCLVITDASSPDGTKPDALFIVSTESGEKRQLTTPHPPFLADSDPALSPDGRRLVFRREIAPFSGQLQLAQLDPNLAVVSPPRSLTPILLTAYNPKWISNDEIIFSAKAALWRMRVGDAAGPERLPFVGDDGSMPAVSPAVPGRPGRLVYVRSFADLNVWRIETSAPGAPASSAPAPAIASTRRDVLAQLSPDGRRVTFISDRSGESEIWAADASGENAVQLTSLGANPGYPRWSPDGRTIAFHSNSETHAYGALYIVPADGGRARQLTANPTTDVFPSFSRDGRWIYFSSSRSATPSIWKIPASGGSAVQVSASSAPLALESWDGTSLFYVESRMIDVPGPLWQLSLKGAAAPVKLADGVMPASFDVIEGGIYYVERLSGDAQLRYLDLANRRSTVVAANLGRVSPGVTAARDGRAILYSRIDSWVNDLMLVDDFR